jgi:hypothetical protein
MKTKAPLLPLLAVTLMVSVAGASAKDSTVKRIISGLPDGDKTYYPVTCINGQRTTIYVEHSTETTCTLPRKGKPQCEKEGLLKDAAERACKTLSRG